MDDFEKSADSRIQGTLKVEFDLSRSKTNIMNASKYNRNKYIIYCFSVQIYRKKYESYCWIDVLLWTVFVLLSLMEKGNWHRGQY